MKILHICPGYIGNKIYIDLFTALAKVVDYQYAFVPIPHESMRGKNAIAHDQIALQYDACYSQIERYLFYPKRNRILKTIITHYRSSGADLVHAHTLVSAGSVAYEYWKKTGIPYIVSVRNTDVDVFMKYCLWLRPYIWRIIKNAKKVVFLTPALRKRTFEYYRFWIDDCVENKSVVVPNGINDFWHENAYCVSRDVPIGKPIEIAFAGSLDRNKNVLGLVKAIKILRKRGMPLQLSIAGNGRYCDTISELASRNDWIHYLGFISDRAQLVSLYRRAQVFAMPSFRETFGLVYIEAMSQGLPVVYSKGQGIDGSIALDVGVSCDPRDLDSMAYAIVQILDHYREYSSNASKAFLEFRWSTIALSLIKIYDDALDKNL